MESALVSVSTGVMKPLLSKLTKLLGEEYVKLKGVRKQIKFLRDELSVMSSTLDMLADAEKLDPNMRVWRDRLRELAYDLEDCVDAFVVRVEHNPDGISVFERFFHELKKLKARHDFASQMEELRARVIETSERHRRYDLAELKNKSCSSSVDPRMHTLYEDVDKLVGIDGPKKRVNELLNLEANNESSTKLKVVTISGCGGLGKTTLAKQVYDDIKSHFKCAAFVSVSRTPDVRKILVHIADGVKCPGIITKDDDEQQLIDKLREHLHDKRYIVVIDDVWQIEAWESIKFAFPNNDLRSRIITTTRSLTVAKYSSSQVYEMVPLSFDDSKRLFFKRSISSENPCYGHLDDVPDRILRKCGGLPLAIVTVSSMLTNKHAKAEWDRVLNEIGSALANNTDAKKMTSILSLSFFDIPHHLRTCLLYLSVFPEDHEIEKQRLINRWIAEGFVHEEERRTTYEIGEGYFNDLINRSMIQPVNVEYGQAKACRVHDMILDYIKCKAAEENFVTSLDGAEPEYKCKVRRLCVRNHSEENDTLWVNQILSHVRSVTIFGQPVKITLLPSTALRVLDLDLEHRGMKYLQLESIGKLFNLKYLRLYSGSITKLPAENVGQLQHLQTLDVRGTRIKELPPTIIKLQHLTRLYVNWHARFPDGVIRRMLNLEEMREYGVVSYEQGQSLLEFSKLTKLRTLKMRWDFNLPDSSEGRSHAEGIHSYVGNLLSSCDIHNLYITQLIGAHPLSLDSWHFSASCSLRKLCIRNCPTYRVPNLMCTHRNLSVLELMIICVRPEDVDILGKIPSLLFLNISTTGGTNGRIIVNGKSGFRSLKYFSLDISVCGTILEFEAGSMPNVERVNLALIVHEMDLSVQDDDIFWARTNVAPSLGIHHLSTLNKVEIKIRGDTVVRWVSRVINDAIKTLPNCPIVRVITEKDCECKHFESALREWIQDSEELAN